MASGVKQNLRLLMPSFCVLIPFDIEGMNLAW